MATAQQTPDAPVSGVTQNPSIAALVIDDSPLCREMLGKTLSGNGITASYASDGVEGIAQLKEHPFDLVLLDNDMPRMNGLAFLKAMRAETKWDEVRVVMLTTNASKEVVIEALRYRISDYLLKEKFSMPDLLVRVRKSMERKPTPPPPPPPPKPTPPPTPAIQVPNLVPHDATLAAIADFASIKTLAGTVSELAALANSPRLKMADVIAIARQDPVIAARWISQASKDGGAESKSRIVSLGDAVHAIGVKEACDLAAGIGVLQRFPTDRADGMSLLRCWQHVLAVADVMKRIVPKTDSVPPGLPHLVGLCHDLAEICLRQKLADEFLAAGDFAQQAQIPVTDLLENVFGASYKEMTKSLLSALAIPAIIAEPIVKYADKYWCPVDAHDSVLTRSLAISNFAVHGMLLASSVECTVAPVSIVDCRSVLIPTAAINTSEIRSEAMTTACILANVPAAESASLVKPLFEKRNVPVCYVRHAIFAALDPIEIALRELCNPTVHSAVPRAEHMTEFDAVVLMTPAADPSLSAEAVRICAAAKKQIPILHLVAGDLPAGERSDPIECASCPVPIRVLAEFISKIGSR
ncbi:MAG TPA: response regulator [Tepidisphaeraceae bacterium]|nr:response regulator [Tepidisphaeraceae bacterium]